MSLFGVDSTFYKFGTAIADVFVLGLLWIIFSIPLFTVGASTTAVYYVCTKKVSGSDAYVFTGFLKSFKRNFFASTFVTLILGLLGYVAWINFHLLRQVELGMLRLPVQVSLAIVCIQLVFITMYVFPIISRFDTSVKGALKTALQLSNSHLLLTIINFVLFAALGFVTMAMPVVFIFMPGIFTYFSSILFVRIFRKHKPDF